MTLLPKKDRTACPHHTAPTFGCRECVLAARPTLENDILAAAADSPKKADRLAHRHQAELAKRHRARDEKKKEAELEAIRMEDAKRREALRHIRDTCGHERLTFGCRSCFEALRRQ